MVWQLFDENKEWVSSFPLSIFIICILKGVFYCKHHLQRTHHTLTNISLLSMARQTLRLAQVLGACTNVHLLRVFKVILLWNKDRRNVYHHFLLFCVCAIHFDYQSKMCTIQLLDNVLGNYFYSLCLHQSNSERSIHCRVCKENKRCGLTKYHFVPTGCKTLLPQKFDELCCVVVYHNQPLWK